ncbi:MAG: dihydroxyacetone kinase subunit DhaL [Chloroflexi bacterium]|nr:dihydroxyacetone kinase subunit DhaL [Chloroflexota bacterium]
MNQNVIDRDSVLQWLQACAQIINQKCDDLNQLDSAVGDGDHGVNMRRGFQAVVGKLPNVAGKDISDILKMTGMTLLSTVGGACGPLYATFFLQVAYVTTGKLALTLTDWAQGFEAGVNGILSRGKVKVGERTVADALVPAAQALKDALGAGQSFSSALRLCALAAQRGVQSTATLAAQKGRAALAGGTLTGMPDAGAMSAYLLVEATVTAWGNE